MLSGSRVRITPFYQLVIINKSQLFCNFKTYKSYCFYGPIYQNIVIISLIWYDLVAVLTTAKYFSRNWFPANSR